MSEATLFSLSGGRKIPHPRNVLLGFLPLTIDAVVRVVGQAIVLTYAPACLYLALPKLFFSLKVVLPLAYGRQLCVQPTLSSDDGHFEGGDSKLEEEHFHQKTKTLVINSLAGLVCPIPFTKSSNITRQALRKYFAYYRIILNTFLLIELFVILVLTEIYRGELQITGGSVLPNWVTIPTNDIALMDCTEVCQTKDSANSTFSQDLMNQTTFNNPYDECVNFVALTPSSFFVLSILMIPSSIYTIIDSILMLCGVKTFSDKLLFDQGDLPGKVNKLTEIWLKDVFALQIHPLKPLMCLSKTLLLRCIGGVRHQSEKSEPVSTLAFSARMFRYNKRCQNKATEKRKMVKMF